MELWTPSLISLNDTSHALIEDAENAARRVDALRPLPPEVVRRIESELMGEGVYSSNAIEGNTLDLRETVMILEKGIEGYGKKREALEARNLGRAVRKVAEWIHTSDCHSLLRFQEAHATIMVEIDDAHGGRFRDKRVMIQGATHQPPDHELVDSMIARVMEHLRCPEDESAVLRATWAHWAIARIHPFFDGNGRMARLWQDLVLLQGKLTSAIIRPEDRRDYLDALSTADDGDFNPLVQLVAQRVARTCDKYLIEITRQEELGEWVEDVVGEVNERAQERRKLDYIWWSRQMAQLRQEFELCASRITEASRDMKIHVQRFDLIDQVRWENVRAGVGAERTWYFVLDFHRGAICRRYYFFFGKHFPSPDLDNAEERNETRVCLLISEDDGDGKGVLLDQIPGCRLSLREVFTVGRTFVRKQVNAAGEPAYDRDVSSLQVAKDFISDVVRQRLI